MSTRDHSGQSQTDPGQDIDAEMAAEYDFASGNRGKHAEALHSGYTIVVHKGDGTSAVQEVAPRPGLVVLAPDVRDYFPDSDAVNRALRGLIQLIPSRPTPSESR